MQLLSDELRARRPRIYNSLVRGRNVVERTVRRGDRIVFRPPAGTRFGNLLYLWLQADIASRSGRPGFVLHSASMHPFLEEFPRLQELTIRPQDVRFNDEREWDHSRQFYQRFGTDFEADDLDRFLRDRILPGLSAAPQDELLVNIRRGDYYSVARFRADLGMDIPAYLAAALEAAPALPRIRVVSDDPEWCRSALGAMLSGHCESVEYDPQDAIANFRAIAGHRAVIGTNSTFTYWGAYAATAMFEDARIIMPSFFARHLPEGRAFQLDPRWTVIETADADRPG